jgi:hypothetical protein
MTTTAALLSAIALLALCAGGGGVASGGPEADPPRAGERLNKEQVLRLARVALAGISREYPNKPGAVLRGPEDILSPREMHPAFYGCFDWHSAVHGHWMLVRLLRLYPELEELRREALPALSKNLTAANLKKETAYFEAKENQSFERTYGWAWLLCLAREVRAFDDEAGRRWAQHLRPLEQRLVELATAYLPKMHLPIRSGEHRDTAFGLAFFLDYARAVGNTAFETLVKERALAWYGRDLAYPEQYEPSGHDFFSAALNEADLMRRVLPAAAYGKWLGGFLPGLAARKLVSLATPATVSDVTDGKLVHLAGLNLTRAWTMRAIAAALPKKDARRAYLDELARAHTAAGFAYVFTGHYAGEHWLASFAVYLVTDAGL